MEKLRRIPDVLLELLYPRRAVCMGCASRAGFPREWLCEECRTKLADSWIGAAPSPDESLFGGAAFAYRYNGPAGGLVRNLKYQGVRLLAEPMGRDMARAFEAIQPTGADCLTCVPMHPKRLRQRGFNHAEALARKAADELELPFINALTRVRNTLQQARLSDDERRTNLDGAFEPMEPVEGRRVILVDDVCTTGSTASACARLMLERGARAVYLLCYARAGKEDENGRNHQRKKPRRS